MKYHILDPEVQKTYYYVKQLLDSQGYTRQLGLYLKLGQRNQPEEWKDLGWGYVLKPLIILLFIIGIVLMFTRHILFGIGTIVVGILISSFFGRKIEKYLENLPSIESAFQKTGSHKLMRIVADEMSKGASMEQIAEALKKEIRETLTKNEPL